MMILLDADKIEGDVSVRYRKDGDFISPEGMIGTKKLKKVFIDLKIPKEKRDKISLLTKGDEILFIPGIRKTKNYRADENTKNVLAISYKRVD
ncbi:MAG: tRNA lysidine(34) synthetase TilS [Clostridia bacterium]|nr:tRNA lysidine(34) synthetase TilS [Clostridia bacterium]